MVSIQQQRGPGDSRNSTSVTRNIQCFKKFANTVQLLWRLLETKKECFVNMQMAAYPTTAHLQCFLERLWARLGPQPNISFPVASAQQNPIQTNCQEHP